MAAKTHNGSLHSTPGVAPEEDILLVFGSQALSLNPSAFEALRSSVWDTPEQAWVSEVIASLPACWDAFVKVFPKFAVVDPGGRDMLVDLPRWLRDGTRPTASNNHGRSTSGESRTDWNWKLPNMILSPLVVIAQLVECVQFLDMTTASGSPPRVKSTVGFCTGLLSAVSASLGGDKEQIQSYGATSIRLAMLIGAVVDAQEIIDAAGPARALATAWTTAQVGEDELRSTLKQVPGVSTSSPEI